MQEYGVIGLGVMGAALSLNLAEKVGTVCGFDLSSEKRIGVVTRAADEGFPEGRVIAHESMEEFVKSLSVPRRIVMLVPAGRPVDACLASLRELLSPGDVVMDGGNEWFEETERREAEMASKGIHYMGCGVSGGAEGARHGPALMVGGPKEAWELMSTALLAIAARAPNTNEPCVVYCGSGGAGNYVKMVHNGIEYGDMQLIGEVFAMFKAKGMENAEIAAIFERWNSPDHALRSFLVEITSKVLLKEEMKVVLDKAGSKGTGKWTVQEAAQLGVPAPTVSAALEARYLSSLKDLRVEAGTIPTNNDFLPDEDLETMLSDALVCSKICSYAQGLSLICEAKKVHGWTDLQLTNVLDCWRGGCIIRAKLIGDFRAAVLDQTDDARFNLLAAPSIDSLLRDRQRNWRRVVAAACLNGIPVPALANSLAYFDSMHSPYLDSAALIQAQRDCFGGHTYKRLDKPIAESFTTDWMSP